MTNAAAEWEQRLSELWASLDDRSEAAFLGAMERLAAELPAGSGIGIFERASAFDSTGHSDRAVPLYQQALDLGLSGERRRRAAIQLASSLRNLGRAQESVALLTTELDAGSDELDDAVRAFLTLALVDTGREREAASLALTALAPHLPRYQRSLANYAQLLRPEEGDSAHAERFPVLRQVVLDCTDARALAEFYRELLGLHYRPGDEPPAPGEPDVNGQDWLVLRDGSGTNRVAFQPVAELPAATWPDGPTPQMLHLDLTVDSVSELDAQDARALSLGARLLRDRSEDPDEPLRVYADPAGHPFCIFVVAPEQLRTHSDDAPSRGELAGAVPGVDGGARLDEDDVRAVR